MPSTVYTAENAEEEDSPNKSTGNMWMCVEYLKNSATLEFSTQKAIL